MHHSKCLGLTIFNSTLFFQKYWQIVAYDGTLTVLYRLNSRTILKAINFTHIERVPKVESPKILSQFCLISLCNVIYKIFSKVLANRLKKVYLKWFQKNKALLFRANWSVTTFWFEILNYMNYHWFTDNILVCFQAQDISDRQCPVSI